MRQIFISMLLLVTFNFFGQNLNYDLKRDNFPHIDILYPDSINSVNIYKYSKDAFFLTPTETPKSKGKLLYHVVLDDNHRKSEIINYNTTTGSVDAKYKFNYSPDNIEEITMLNSNNKIVHYWLLKNRYLIEELRYNFKQELTDKWSYSYISDTLIENITKYKKPDNVLYELKFKYDSLNRLIEKKEYKNDSLVNIKKMIYDSAGKLNRIKYYPPKVTVVSYGNKNHVVSRNISDENTLEYHFIEFQYDSLDRVLKKTWFRNDSAIEDYVIYSYEPSGKLLNITEYNKRNKPTLKQVFEYNDFCRLNGYAEYQRNMGKKLIPMVEWKKIENKCGNIDKVEIIYRYEKKTVLYTYEYQ